MTDPGLSRKPPLWCWLALNAVAATWLAFSSLLGHLSSDGFILSLTSQYAWTPFFWQQDRVGMFVPLLTKICPDAVWNLTLQAGLHAFAGLCLPLLLAELIEPHWIGRLAATLSNILMLAFAADPVPNMLLLEYHSPLAMSLGCAGLLLLGRGRGWPTICKTVLAAICFVTACWVHLGLPIWLVPLALVRSGMAPVEPNSDRGTSSLVRRIMSPRCLLALSLIVAAFGMSYGFGLVVRQGVAWMQPTPQSGLPVREWPAAWRELWNHCHIAVSARSWWDCAMLGGASFGITITLVRGATLSYPFARATIILLVPAVCECLFMGTRQWVAWNDFHPRYILGSLVCVQLICTFAAVLPASVPTFRRNGFVFFVLAASALLGVIGARYGLPTPDRPRNEIDALAASRSVPLLESDVDAIGGDYWTVWPTVSHVNMLRREQGEARPFLGVTDRGRVLLETWDWKARPSMRVAVIRDAREWQWFMIGIELCGLAPPEKIGEHGPFEVYVVRPLTPYR